MQTRSLHKTKYNIIRGHICASVSLKKNPMLDASSIDLNLTSRYITRRVTTTTTIYPCTRVTRRSIIGSSGAFIKHAVSGSVPVRHWCLRYTDTTRARLILEPCTTCYLNDLSARFRTRTTSPTGSMTPRDDARIIRINGFFFFYLQMKSETVVYFFHPRLLFLRDFRTTLVRHGVIRVNDILCRDRYPRARI